MVVTELHIEQAANIIRNAESELGKLTDGQRRDLLADNTEFSMDAIAAIVKSLRGSGTVGDFYMNR